MTDEPFDDDDLAPGAPSPRPIAVTLAEGGIRLDRALASAIDPAFGLSRSRLRDLIETGCVVDESGRTLRDPSAKVKAGLGLSVTPPPPRAATPQAEAIPLSVIHEDADLIVVDKPAGMAVHPAPGSETGTLVNALLAHCPDDLSGIGGEARPGIVHRIDKDTTGLLVVAKTDRAHQGLAAQFAEHSIARLYQALVWGAPDLADPRLAGLAGLSFARPPETLAGDAAALVWGRIETEIARSKSDRKKMAAVRSGGRRAVTWFRAAERYGDRAGGGAAAALVACRLETGRTHQIRVHMAYAGHGLIGDPLYGRASASRLGALGPAAQAAAASLGRQALHAAALGFIHPVSGERLSFEAPPPADFEALRAALATP